MKKPVCIALVLILLLCLTGCSTSKTEPREPVFFYYRQAEMQYGTNPGVIGKEARESAGHRSDYSYLLTQYLSGPESYELVSPFPAGTSLKSIRIDGSTAYVQLSPTFSTLTGMKLSIACACITMTVCEITGAERVTVSVAGTLLGGSPQITMSREELLLLDDSNIVIDPA